MDKMVGGMVKKVMGEGEKKAPREKHQIENQVSKGQNKSPRKYQTWTKRRKVR